MVKEIKGDVLHSEVQPKGNELKEYYARRDKMTLR